MPMRTSQNVPSRISNEAFSGSGGGDAGSLDAENWLVSATVSGGTNGGEQTGGDVAASDDFCGSRITRTGSGGITGGGGMG